MALQPEPCRLARACGRACAASRGTTSSTPSSSQSLLELVASEVGAEGCQDSAELQVGAQWASVGCVSVGSPAACAVRRPPAKAPPNQAPSTHPLQAYYAATLAHVRAAKAWGGEAGARYDALQLPE